MRVFLTGGTGLLGSHLAAELRAHGHEVVALHRSGSDTRFLEEHSSELVEGDVRGGSEALAAAMDGCTHVAHGAAVVYARAGWPEIESVNVGGTRNVLAAAVAAGVQHAVHISSVATYGTVDGEVDERQAIDRPLPPDDLYARSKREAEAVARAIEDGGDLRVTIVRPSAVYGERDRLLVPSISDIVRLPLVPLFGSGANTLPVVYAGNVASAIRLVLEAGRARETFDIGLDHPLTQRELMAYLALGLGRRPRFLSLPAGLVRAGVGVLSRLGVGTPGASHLPIERVARLALGENPYPSRRIRAELGWAPLHEHEKALERTGRWLAARR